MSAPPTERPWLLLHGFTGEPESFGAITTALGSGNCLAPRLTGHGPVPFPRSNSFEVELERLAQLVRQRFTRPIGLLGYSLGARLGLGLLADNPGLFDRGVLIGVNPGLESVPERAARRVQEAQLIKLLEQRGLRHFVDYWQSQPLFATQAGLPAQVLARQERSRLSHTAEGLCLALSALGLGNMPSLWSALPKLDVLLDIVVGEHDEKFERLGRRMLRALPRAQFWRVPKVGHNVLLEAPEFLKQRMLGA